MNKYDTYDYFLKSLHMLGKLEFYKIKNNTADAIPKFTKKVAKFFVFSSTFFCVLFVLFWKFVSFHSAIHFRTSFGFV